MPVHVAARRARLLCPDAVLVRALFVVNLDARLHRSLDTRPAHAEPLGDAVHQLVRQHLRVDERHENGTMNVLVFAVASCVTAAERT